jgi:hypothetical protein
MHILYSTIHTFPRDALCYVRGGEPVIILHKIIYAARQGSRVRTKALLTTWTKIYCTGTQIPINPSLRSQIYSDNFRFRVLVFKTTHYGESGYCRVADRRSTCGVFLSNCTTTIICILELDIFKNFKQFSHL